MANADERYTSALRDLSDALERFQRIENAALASGSLTDKIRRDSGPGDMRSCQPKGGTLA